MILPAINTQEYYPPLGFHFRVIFENINTEPADFNFQSVSGLTSEVVTENYKEGGLNQYEHVLPVKTQYPDLVLKRGLLVSNSMGIIKANDLQQWCQKTMQTLMVQPSNLIITLLNTAGKPLMTWNVKHAWPKKWAVSDFDAEQNQVVIETIELTYHSFTLI